jgi:hypothetical protein
MINHTREISMPLQKEGLGDPSPRPQKGTQFRLNGSVIPLTPAETPTEQTAPVEQVAAEQAAVAESPHARKPRTRQAKAGDGKERKLSALDAAPKVLGKVGPPMPVGP